MSSPLKAVLDANPDLGHGLPPFPQPGGGIRLSTVRAQQPGGEIMGYVPSDGVVWFEQLYRVLPPRGMYNALPNRPVTFTMGSFRVPRSMVLVVLDYAFNIYRFSGASPGDFIPIESSRLSTQVTWDINIDNTRPGNLSFQILPKAQSQAQEGFAPNGPLAPPQQWQFDQIRATQNQVPGGAGLSMLPQRRHRDGLVKVANTYVAKASSSLNVACSIINRIPIPIGFFEADICGILLPQNVYEAYQAAGVPVGNPLVPPIPGAP